MHAPISVESLRTVRTIEFNGEAVISVTSAGATHPLLVGTGPLLQLHFDDLEEMPPTLREHYKKAWGRYPVLFDLEMAKKVLEFYNKHVKPTALRLYVHCEAGISRSAGIASALSQIEYGHDNGFCSPPYHPNGLVRRCIFAASGYGYYKENAP